MRWTVPRLWPGETVAVFATGPSLTQEDVDAVHAAGIPAIAVNDAYRLAPWAGILYAADANWWREHEPAWGFAGHKVCAQPTGIFPGVVYMRHSGIDGFDPDPSFVRTGANSGYQAVHVAIHTGAARILLLGFDMHGTHFFGKHERPLRNTHPDSFKRWIDRFGALNNRGAEIINCTQGSALECFPKMRLSDVLNQRKREIE